MDGDSAPNITIGPDIVKAVRHCSDKPFDVHLMIAPCDPYLEVFAKAGADHLIVHVEAGPHLHRSLQEIRALGKKAGVTLNPGTPVCTIEPVIDIVDLILGGMPSIRGSAVRNLFLRRWKKFLGCARLPASGRSTSRSMAASTRRSLRSSPAPAPMCWSPATPCSGRTAQSAAVNKPMRAISRPNRNAAAMARCEVV